MYLSPDFSLQFHKVQDLRYGENPHQKAAWYFDPTVKPPEMIQGKPLSYTNIIDLDAALRIASSFTEPSAVLVKHTSPCGVAVAESCGRAYKLAREADPISAFGGIVGINRQVDSATASLIIETFIECVIAPGVNDEAREILATKENMRVVIVDPRILGPLDSRSALGGYLIQERDTVLEVQEDWGLNNPNLKVVTRRIPTGREWQQLRFAWLVCAHVKSNAVIFTRDEITIGGVEPFPQYTYGIGGGQPNRVSSAQIAAGALLPGGCRYGLVSVVASDAFFPFRDGLDVVAKAGATAVVQPGGSKRDEEVIAAADEHNMAMVFTGVRHFRH